MADYFHTNKDRSVILNISLATHTWRWVSLHHITAMYGWLSQRLLTVEHTGIFRQETCRYITENATHYDVNKHDLLRLHTFILNFMSHREAGCFKKYWRHISHYMWGENSLLPLKKVAKAHIPIVHHMVECI